MTTYHECRSNLKEFAKSVKKELKGDKPAIREAINNYCDMLIRELSHPRNGHSERALKKFGIWLSANAAKLHP